MMPWTRRAALLLALTSVLGLTGCGVGKPETAARDFYKKVSDNKVDEAVAMFSTRDIKAEQMVMARGKFTAYVGQIQGTMQANGGLDDVVNDGVDVQSEELVTVRSTLRYKNGKTQKDAIRLAREDGKWLIRLGPADTSRRR